jgi:hypothetical protein
MKLWRMFYTSTSNLALYHVLFQINKIFDFCSLLNAYFISSSSFYLSLCLVFNKNSQIMFPNIIT